ncbi:MAG TPA: hypothetical protein VFP61_13110 [Acidimicrobiales bacterium]|nr:hypothetical protein [Acidimicrobiales bacterium]
MGAQVEAKGEQRCERCAARAATVITTAAGRRLCQACADRMFGKVAALLAAPDQPVADLVTEVAQRPGWAEKVRIVRRRRSARA